MLLCEGKSQEIYGIGNKVIEYWGKKIVCVCVYCMYIQEKNEEKTPTHVYLYLWRGKVFFLVCVPR